MPLSPDVVSIIAAAKETLGLEDRQQADVLEACAAYYALQHAGLDAGDAAAAIEKVATGGGEDGRLDAIAFIVNGAILTPDHDIEFLRPMLEAGRDVQATIVCVQATGADPANPATPELNEKINGFTTGIQAFLIAPATAPGRSDSVRRWMGLRDRLFELFDDYGVVRNCRIKAYLVWPYTRSLRATHLTDLETFRQTVSRIIHPRLGGDVEFEFVDDSKLVQIDQDLRRRAHFPIPRQILASGPVTIGAAQIFTGFMSATAFVDLISITNADGSKKILHKLFYDNVRAYLGDSGGVNADIRSTLLDPGQRPQFHLRSNGVAVIARSVEQGADALTFRDVQIVNGCQTSYSVVAALDSSPGDDWSVVHVPIRIVVCDNDAMIDEMILGLNRQAAVDDFQIYSRRDYVIRLFQYIVARNREQEANRIWFERRAGEFKHVKQEARVLTMRDMMGAYASVFMTKPHATLTPSQLLGAIKDKRLFDDRHAPEFYYLAAVMTMRLRQSLANGAPAGFDTNAVRAQLLYALRLLVDRQAKTKCPASRSGNPAQAYLASIGQVILKPQQMQSLCIAARTLVGQAATSARDRSGRTLSGAVTRQAAVADFTRRVEELAAAWNPS